MFRSFSQLCSRASELIWTWLEVVVFQYIWLDTFLGQNIFFTYCFIYHFNIFGTVYILYILFYISLQHFCWKIQGWVSKKKKEKKKSWPLFYDILGWLEKGKQTAFFRPYWLGDIWCCLNKVSTFLFHTLHVCKSLHSWLGCNINIKPVARGHYLSICDPTPANEALCGKIYSFELWAKMLSRSKFLKK